MSASIQLHHALGHDQIAGWRDATPAERKRILAALPERRARLPKEAPASPQPK
ncbi:hypothetical protein [Methylosinus sp. RM1]|uniref:hypothetical protein n=1 Tax=Methylosinus sp. RM1 TaxID=2583817 RepID=UPI001FED6C58|nr:hypothetical protein [Methylosinus sp. RM1]